MSVFADCAAGSESKSIIALVVNDVLAAPNIGNRVDQRRAGKGRRQGVSAPI